MKWKELKKMGTEKHRKNEVKKVKIAVITVSTTRNLSTDKSGAWIKKRAIKEGHQVVLHKVIPDDIEAVVNTALDTINQLNPNAILFTGGTGISSGDVTVEALQPLFAKELVAFGFIFAQLSFQEIDSAAVLSRSCAGIIGHTAVFCMPGSLKACKLACREIIFPEIGHIIKHITE